jgi:hypothetical protein
MSFTQEILHLYSSAPTLTSNWVSRIFWLGLAKGKIQKNAKHIFLKEAKTAAFQLRSPPAPVEANALLLRRGSLYDAAGRK